MIKFQSKQFRKIVPPSPDILQQFDRGEAERESNLFATLYHFIDTVFATYYFIDTVIMYEIHCITIL